MCLQFGFVIFWQKDFGAKAAHKMLVKLTQLSHFLTICPSILFVLLFSRTYFLLFFLTFYLYHPQSFSPTCSLSFSLVLSSYFSSSLVFSCSLSFSRVFLVLSSSFSPILSTCLTISRSLPFSLVLSYSLMFYLFYQSA